MIKEYTTRQWKPGESFLTRDRLVEEEPLTISLNGKTISITMRTPGHDRELGTGFLITEGIIRRHSDIQCWEHDRNRIEFALSPEVIVDLEGLTRYFPASSSCGVCGRTSIERVRMDFPQVESRLKIGARCLLSFPDKMRQGQAAFEQTGGIHAAAIFSPDGEILVVREDIGRHNAVDKVIGYALLSGKFPLSEQILMVSGRVSFEIVQKALAAGFPMIAAVSAASSLAVALAEKSNQTLIGFLRDDRMNIYVGENRIIL